MRHLNTIYLLLASSLVTAISIDCPKVISLAAGLNMNDTRPLIWNQLQNDCCSAPGIQCDGSQSVTQIAWIEIGLTGRINETSLPLGLTYLNLDRNSITGYIPTALPPRLTYLNLDRNYISGSLPITLPSGLTDLILSGNFITGSIPSTLPSTLSYLILSGNLITGSIPVPLPLYLRKLYLYDNFLNGTIQSFPSGLQYLDLHSNLLTEQLPALPSGLVSFNVASNKFTGSVTLNKPTSVDISSNWITDISIQDISALSSCSLSNNPLLGNPNIANLTICAKNGLYFPGLLPETKTSKMAIVRATPSTSSSETSAISTEISTTLNLPSEVFVTYASSSFESVESSHSSAINQSTPTGNSESPFDLSLMNSIYLLGALGAFVGLVVILLIMSRVVKHPKMHSKFGRKNSFGTLNTMVSKQTV